MSFLLLSTTAMAYTKTVNKYNKTYEYTGTGNEMKWMFKGSNENVRTKTTNPTAYSRYVEASVIKYKVYKDTYVSSKGDSNEGKQVYANIAMARSMKDTKIYYVHGSGLKPSASNGYVIDSLTYKITQKK